MSLEVVTKDIKDERQPMGKRDTMGLKWVENNIGCRKPRCTRTSTLYTTRRLSYDHDINTAWVHNVDHLINFS